jgi:gliding motility-associated-like protein
MKKLNALRLSLFAAFMLVFLIEGRSQTVDTAMPIQDMVQNLVGSGVQISNIVLTAPTGSYGYYTSTASEIGTSEGILLSTGKAINALGPNDETGLPLLGPPPTFTCLNCSQYNNNAPGSALLNQAQDRNTFDAAQIEFDIIPQGDSLRFAYTFASEEYNEWVGSPFNDVFGFFISGPNIGTDVNIALIPNTSTAVAINSVNANTNSQYWQNNSTPPGAGWQCDAFTVSLAAAVGNLIPCETYHLKLVIADGSDRLYDSWVFVNQIESNPVIVASATAGGLDYMIEGCNDGTITFSRQEASASPQVVTYFVGGTATSGVDYTLLGTGVPLEPITITIPANQLSVSIPIEAFDDQILEGDEYLTIFLANPNCTTTEILDSLNFYIQDLLEVDVQASSTQICGGQCVDLVGTALTEGSSSFVWSPTDDMTNSNTLTPTVCPTVTTTYTLTSTVADCEATDQIEIQVSYISLGLDTDPITCGNASSGTVDLTVLNANAPYTFSWTGPNGFVSSDEDLTDLADGEYCVDVTDASGCTASGCVTVIEIDILEITDVEILLNGCFPISCTGACDGAVNVSVTGGETPYLFAWLDEDNNLVSIEQNATNLCAGTYLIRVTDNNGCVIFNTVVLEEPEPVFVNLIGQVDVLCDGTSTGSITVDASGGCSPYFYNWSGYPANTSPQLIDIPSGNYNVSVTDANGCSSANELDIIVNDPIDPLVLTIDEVSLYPGGFNTSCPTSNDAYINATASLGTTPYIVEWLNQSTGQVVATDLDAANLDCGVYTITVTDANGCERSETVELTCPPAIAITSETVPNPCGDETAGLGEISILTTTGGNGGPYTYSYSGPSCATCNTEDLTGLNSGSYTLTVTDGQGCTEDFNISVGTDSDFSVSHVVTQINCGGACNGSINSTITPAGTYTIEWTDGDGNIISNAEDLNNLCPGDYEMYVEQAGCFGVFNFTITEPDPLIVTQGEVVQPVCFGQNTGSIDINVFGGIEPYTFEWTANNGCIFFGSSDEDITGLFECCYTVVVTDASGCTATLEVCLDAPEVMSLFVSTPSDDGSLFDISCNGANDGSISVSVNGGTPDCNLFAPECYLFDWSVDVTIYGNPANASFIENLPTGTYIVNVTDINGCLATTTIDLSEPEAIQSAPIITDVTCNGNNDGTITPNINGGTESYVNYLWAPSVSPNADDATTLTNLDPGTYTVTITDSNNCEQEFTYTVNEPETLTAEVSFTNPTACSADCDGVISVNPVGGVGPYAILVSGPNGNSNGPVVGDLCEATYSITVTDANGCTFTDNVTLDAPDTFEVLVSPNDQTPGQLYLLSCFGDCTGSLTALVTGGTAPFTYAWTDGLGNIIGSEDTANNLCADNYCVQVTDANGCSVVECFEVTQPSEPLSILSDVFVYPSGYNISCYGACDGAIDLTVTGGVPGYTFLWNDGNGFDPTEDQANLCAAYIEVLITDDNGCSELVFWTLTEPAPIVINETISTFDGNVNVSCNGACDGTISVEVLGGEPGYTITWPSLGLSEVTEVSALCAGIYDVEVTDNIGCVETETYTIEEPTVVAGTIEANFDCILETTELCAQANGGSGNYAFTWSTGESTECITVASDGEYCVTITDSNGCEYIICFDLVTPDPVTTIVTSTDATCGICNGTINLTTDGGTGTYFYDWTGANTTDDQEDQFGLCAGTYGVIVSDENGCTVTISGITILDSPIPSASVISSNASCNGSGDGTAAVTTSNTVGNVTASWTLDGQPYSTDLNLTDLGVGVYVLTLTDESGCPIPTQTVTITEPAVLVLDGDVSLFEGGFNVSASGANDGSIDITVTGGTAPYTYDWSNITGDDDAEDIGNLVAGEYTVTVIDENGCTTDSTFTLIQEEELGWPTGLTPNDDGFNDVYFIQGLGAYAKNEFKVFNRWGNLVYEKTNYDQDWRGQNSDNEELPDGTYFVVFTSGNTSFNTYVDLRR